MKISKLFAAAGKYGTVAVEIAFGGIYIAGILIINKYVKMPVKEDTRAELVEQGFSVDEIKEAEGSAKGIIMDAVKNVIGRYDRECLDNSEGADVFDDSQADRQPQTSTA